MLILVDGYNVTMKDPALAGRSKEVQRDALVARLRALAPSIARRGRIVVVFDAHASLGHSSETDGPVTSAFASSADDEIVRRCTAVKGKVIVYTGDMRLRARISQDVGRHVEYRDVSALFATSLKPRSTGRGDAVAREDRLPADATDITAELGELWLDDGE